MNLTKNHNIVMIKKKCDLWLGVLQNDYNFKKGGPSKWLQYYIFKGGWSIQMITIDYIWGKGSEKPPKLIT